VEKEGSWTLYHPTGKVESIFNASLKYRKESIPLVILAGKEYGSGSSRDWAAKGVALLGVRAIIAESFERIHRSNLVGMGVLPIQFKKGTNVASLGLKGDETFDITDLDNILPNKEIKISATSPSGTVLEFHAIVKLDSLIEIAYYKNGGILQYVLRSILKKNK
jgi:aconitate hydratase